LILPLCTARAGRDEEIFKILKNPLDTLY
jgi:hypothetical protein